MLNFLSGLTTGSCLLLIWHMLRPRSILPSLSADGKFLVFNDWRGGIGRDRIAKERGA